MRIGPPSRGGFTPLANAETARLFNELTLEQFRLYVGLRIEAQYGEAAEVRDAFGRTVRVEPGEISFGIDACAARYGLNRDQVRRAVDRFEQLGLVARRRGVAPATPHAPSAATPRGREAATPPTVLTFLTDREICWRPERTATPHAPSAATPRPRVAATIQHGNPEDRNPAAAARARESASEPGPKLDEDVPSRPRPLFLDESELGPLGARYRAEVEAALGHGLALCSAGEERATKDGLEEVLSQPWLGVERAVEWTLATVRSRRGRPGAEPGSVAWCLKLLRDVRPPPEDRASAAAARAPAEACPEVAQLLEAVRKAVKPELWERWFSGLGGAREGKLLVVVAPDTYKAQFVSDNYRAWFVELAAHVLGERFDVQVRAAAPARAAAGGAR